MTEPFSSRGFRGRRQPGATAARLPPASTRRATSPETEVRRPDGALLFVDTLRLNPTRGDDPTCRLTDRVGDVRERIEEAGWDQCLVVNEQRILLGRLRGTGLAAPDETVVEEVMESGPTTIRSDTRLDAITKRMRERHVGSIVVTTSDGRLLGILVREDAEREDESRRAAATP